MAALSHANPCISSAFLLFAFWCNMLNSRQFNNQASAVCGPHVWNGPPEWMTWFQSLFILIYWQFCGVLITTSSTTLVHRYYCWNSHSCRSAGVRSKPLGSHTTMALHMDGRSVGNMVRNIYVRSNYDQMNTHKALQIFVNPIIIRPLSSTSLFSNDTVRFTSFILSQ